MSLLQRGDRRSYTEIYNRYVLTLLNHAYNKLRDREEARDIVQEVFAVLWSKHETFELNTNLPGYLYTSVRNAILNRIARSAVQRKWLDSMLSVSDNEPLIADHIIREKQLSELIETEIASLSPKMREVFELSRKEHLSHKEIAERLLITEQTVSKHVTNALKILRVRLGMAVYLLLFI